MKIFAYDYNTEKIIFPQSPEDLPSGDLLWGQIYEESDPPTIILDSGNYDPSLSMGYLANIIGKNLGIELNPDDILLGNSKTSSFNGDIALYNGEPIGITNLYEVEKHKVGGISWNKDEKWGILPPRTAKIVDLTNKIDYFHYKQSNILDPVHETLDQDVFNGTEPDLPFFKAHIHKIRQIFEENGYYPEDFEFYLTGSLCTYQYHDTSDVDISILPINMNFSDEERAHLISIIVNELDGENFRRTNHQYQHYLQPNGVNIRDLFAVGMRAGYDFQAEKWVQKPDRMKAVDINKAHPDWIADAIFISDKINSLLDEGYDDEAQRVYNDIHRRRRYDEIFMGDESEGNVVYKFLENNGTFDKLREIGQYIA